MDKEQIGTQLQKFNIRDEAIAILSTAYMPLSVDGLDDKVGLAKVHEARMDIKRRRVDVEKVRKELKEDSLQFGRAVDAEAKRIVALLEPIETHLQNEEDKIANIKAAIEAEKQAQEAARLKAIEDERLAKIAAEHKAEEDRLAAIRAEQEAEAARLRKIADEQAEKERAFRAEQARIEEEKREIERAKQRAADEKRHAAEMEQARKEAAEQARIEAEAKAERDRLAAIRAEDDRKEAERIAAEERPDIEKLMAFALGLEALEYPTVKSASAISIVSTTRNEMAKIISYIRDSAQHKKNGSNRKGVPR